MASRDTARRRGAARVIVVTGLAVALAACSQPTPSATETTPAASTPATTSVPTSPDAASPANVTLQVETVADGLDHPWDLAQLPDGSLLVDERDGRLVRIADGRTTEVEADFSDLFARGETGLMGLALDPAFEQNRRFYTCQGSRDADDIRVIAWTLSADSGSAERVDDPLVSGLELSSGRHGGCRLLFDPTGALLISAGDAARGNAPQDLTVLGGKVLRVDPADGSPAPGNPFADQADETDSATRLVYSYGHRNVQGLAVRPGTDPPQIYAAEHGPSVDDEVNLLRAGGNYGWNPRGSGLRGYDESVPMTDTGIDGAVPAVWSSGSPTVAVSGATFLDGPQWGQYDGRLAVATLRGTHLMLMSLDDAGQVIDVERPQLLDDTHGRLRTAVQGRDGSLYIATDNGRDDQILKVTPQPGE